MKRIVAIFLISIMFLLCSCSNNTVISDFPDIKQPISLVVIIGRHSNAGKPTDGMLAKANELILKAFTPPQKVNNEWLSTANISIIVSQGFPVSVELPKELLKITAPYESNVKDDIIKNAEKIQNLLMSDDIKATSEEVDLIATLEQARVYLNSNSKSLNKYILILDSGITTKGHFDMRKTNILAGEPTDIVNSLPQEQLPDLSGITVIFDGMGIVPKEPTNGQTLALRTNQEAKRALKSVWIELLANKCKATIYNNDIGEVDMGEDQPYLEEGEGYPYVSTISFSPPKPIEKIIEEIKEEIEENKEKEVEPEPPIDIIFNAGTFFKGNSIEFDDPANASENLKNAASTIFKFLNDSRNSNEKIYVVGSIANTQKNLQVFSNEYSAGRANAVTNELKKLLKDTGVDVERIVPIDAGTTVLAGWRDTNEFQNGEWKDDLAKKNRVVAIISSNSQKAQVDGLKPYIQ